MPDNSSRLNEQTMQCVISVTNLSKTYASGFQALRAINLDIRRGEIFCAARPQRRRQDNADQHQPHREPGRGPRSRRRSRHCLVPQELTTDAFETVWATV